MTKLSSRLKTLLLLVAVIIGVLFIVASPIAAQSKVFSADELAQFDGKNDHKAYYAYEGKVYDVTGSKLWKEGEHFGLFAGQDLTGKMGDAPHGTEVFAGFEVVGTYPTTAVAEVSPSATTAPVISKNETEKVWYEGRIKILGLSLLAWTGILLGVFFVLTFSTCFAMPWAKLPLPWKGSKIGADPLDASPKHLPWTSIHKHFVWWTVIFGVVHGVLGLLQLFGLYL